jgi:hypothetical protein
MPMAFEWNMPLDLAGPARLSAPRGEPRAATIRRSAKIAGF